MTALDILILILLGGGALLGFVRGFVQEVFSLGAWVAAVLAVKFGHAPASALLAPHMDSESGIMVAAFVLLFLPAYLVVRLLAQKLGGRTRRSLIGPVDRLLGGLFGMLKGLVTATVLFLIASFATDIFYGADAPRPEWMREARTYPLLNASARATVDLVETQREEGLL
ncbi:CvpA family protein [Sphingomicrobium astaxanthinifaciens]|uniref:CvpA family protein n=1 Tax=Sphingomicrobium astaxanthinifaciens TaxID=1227949 RepID=UPI001FCAE4F1|nr:CvpA family protein [Sphingomicrobium astaxanthinifaciens]MCJ7420634.1 CvpA family protein [Sphingomicrobium astaxanthinifaciens]